MIKRLGLLFFAGLSMTSCRYLEKQVPQKEELLKKELDAINWEAVDEYPSVPDCDHLHDSDERKDYFIAYLRTNIQQRLSADTLLVVYPTADTIVVDVSVRADSTVSFTPVANEEMLYGKFAIDSILQHRLSDFPKVGPAIKRGLPVTTQFQLPVILNIQKR